MKKDKDKEKNYYFTLETQRAIIRYNETDNEAEKNYLYEEFIYYPLYKIAENQINKYKFNHFPAHKKEVKQEVVSFLTSKLDYYKEEKGLAFGYFSVASKNYLIQNNNKHYKDKVDGESIDSYTKTEENYKLNKINLQSNRSITKEKKKVLNEIIKEFSNYIDDNAESIFYKERDIKIAYAISKILKDFDILESLNKKTLYLLIREHSNERSTYITSVIRTLYSHFNEIKDNILEKKFILNHLDVFM